MAMQNAKAAARRFLERFPALKRAGKRAYQVMGYALSNEKIQSEGEMVRVTPDDGFEYFFGYYDKCPWDADDRRMIALRVRQSWVSPAPAEPGELVLIDTGDGNRVQVIATVHAWNVQQGCMAQWLGPDFDRYLLYNDFREGRFCSVIYDTREGREVRILPLPVYDVARDGSFALSLDFSRLHRLRPGYGYSNLTDATAGQLCPDAPCVWRMDLADGTVTPLLKYTDFATFEPTPDMDGAEHKVNHLMLSPDGSRFMVLHRWLKNGHKRTRLVTVNSDGSGMYNLSDDGFVSHCCWKNDGEILSYLEKRGTGRHYYLMKDRTREYRLLWPELARDGHCGYSPDGSRVVTDCYPNRKRLASVYICRDIDNRSRQLARVFSPLRYNGDCRCDLHPRWNHRGDAVCIDSVHEGRRGLYVLPAPKEAETPVGRAPNPDAPLRVLMVNTVPMIFDGITMVMLNYASNMDPEGMQVDFVSGNRIDDALRGRIEATGARIYRIPQRNRRPLRYIWRLSRLIRRNGYQVVHAHGNSCTLAFEMLAARLGGARVRCPHSHNTKSKNITAHRLLRPLFEACYTHGFACGEAAGKWLFHDKPFVVLNNGVDTQRFAFSAADREAVRKELGLEGKVAIGHVAHFTPHKNHAFLIDAFAPVARQDPDRVLVLVGGGRLEGETREKVRALGLEDRVIFYGTTTEVPRVLSAMDLMVLPSLFEGLPNVLIEWQASGLRALVADTVTREARLTDLVEFLPLDRERWTRAMLEGGPGEGREEASALAARAIADAGYDIRVSADRLKELYVRYLSETAKR